MRFVHSVLSLILISLFPFSTASSYQPFEIDIEELQEISPRPGTRITDENFASYNHLIDPDLGIFIANKFFSFTVGEPISFRPHPAFILASRRAAGATQLGPNEGILLNFEEGLPFSQEPSLFEQEAGRKLAWNMRYAYLGDSGKVPEMFWQLKDWRSQK